MKVVHSKSIPKAPNKKTIEEQRLAKIAKKERFKRRLLTTVIAMIISAVLYFFFHHIWIPITIMSIHLFLCFYTFAVWFYSQRNKKRAWAAYMNKYGVNGEIPKHVQMIHKKLIQSGKTIPM